MFLKKMDESEYVHFGLLFHVYGSERNWVSSYTYVYIYTYIYIYICSIDIHTYVSAKKLKPFFLCGKPPGKPFEHPTVGMSRHFLSGQNAWFDQFMV